MTCYQTNSRTNVDLLSMPCYSFLDNVYVKPQHINPHAVLDICTRGITATSSTRQWVKRLNFLVRWYKNWLKSVIAYDFTEASLFDQVIDTRKLANLYIIVPLYDEAKSPGLFPHRSPVIRGCDSQWCGHYMEHISALLALCEGNPPVDFPNKGQ